MNLRAAVLATAASTAAACGAAVGPAADMSGWRYTVSATEDFRRLRTRLCFEGEPPAALVPASDETAAHLAGAFDDRGRRLDVDREGGVVSLDGVPRGGCIRYDLRTSALGRFRYDGAAVFDLDRLLFRPSDGRGDDLRGFRGTLGFDLPPGLDAIAPGGELDWTALRWRGALAIGRFERRTVEAAGVRIDAAVLPGRRRATAAGLDRWLSRAAEAVALVHGGRVPVPRVQVLVLPVPADGDEPVVFGVALRGGGPGLSLLLSEDATDDDLRTDWVALHELFHLGMPFVAPEDAWLSEGITMYYSETLRGRIGAFRPADAWGNLERGFARGRGGGSGRTLRDESRAMSRTGEYRRVYWSGAALALRWDVELRRRSANTRSLDDALAALAEETLSPPRRWTAAELLPRLDRWWGEPLFTRIARPALESRDFPDVGDLYAELGVQVAEDGAVTLDSGAPLAAICRSLVMP